MTPKTDLADLIAIPTAALPAAGNAVPPARAWEIGPWVHGRNYSVGMPASPSPAAGGGAMFQFPVAGRGQIDAMTTPVSSLQGARRITLRYRIDAAGRTRFVPEEAPEEVATVSVCFQRSGDDWSARGRYESYRWYVLARAVVPLAPGVRSVTIGFDEPWVNVHFSSNSQDPEGYSAALANASRIGVAFGSAGLRSYGVYAPAARFTLLGLDIS